MFRDASVSRFAIQDDELRIETEEFSISCIETVPPARIIISRLRRRYRNDVELVAFAVESEDAEIFRLDGSADGVRLHLIWHFWKPKAPEVWCNYWFPGASLRIEAISGGPLVPVQRHWPQD